MLRGGAATTIAVAALIALTVPSRLEAVTRSRIVRAHVRRVERVRRAGRAGDVGELCPYVRRCHWYA